MYVEVNSEKEQVTSPSEFKKYEAKRYVSHVEERIEVLAEEIGRRMKLRDKEWAMSVLRTMLSNLNEEEKRQRLEWLGLTVEDLDKFNVHK